MVRHSGGWSVLVPVKRLAHAKTRLRGAVSADRHAGLVLAMALDTVAAAVGCPAVRQVVVVTDEADARRALTAAGALCVADEPDDGLNPALAHGARCAAAREPDAGIAVLGSDLPALRAEDLAAALAAATLAGAVLAGATFIGATFIGATGSRRTFVADAEGTGTTLLTALPGVELAPAYGPGSAVAHAASGALPLTGDWPSLRRDVDTAADLRAAAALGLGPRTTDLLAARAVR